MSEYLGTVDRNDHCLVVYDVLLDNHTKMYNLDRIYIRTMTTQLLYVQY